MVPVRCLEKVWLIKPIRCSTSASDYPRKFHRHLFTLYSVFLLIPLSSSLRFCFKGLFIESRAGSPCGCAHMMWAAASGTSAGCKTLTIGIIWIWTRHTENLTSSLLQHRHNAIAFLDGRTQRHKRLGEWPEPHGWPAWGPDLCPGLVTSNSQLLTTLLSYRLCWESLPYRFCFLRCLDRWWSQGLIGRAPLSNQSHQGCPHMSWLPECLCYKTSLSLLPSHWASITWYWTLPEITHDLLPSSLDTVDQAWKWDRSGKEVRRKLERKLAGGPAAGTQAGLPETPEVHGTKP